MPPKKQEEKEERPVLGRFKSNLKVGIVGLPNVGKSTTFNLLTHLAIPAENFPFCTIDPNAARVNVPDDRFTWLCDLYKPKSEVPAFLEVVDIAGLVKGASEGQGLGNAFLSNIMAVDGIFHVCRCFDDPDVIHVEDRVDPIGDLEIIHNELRAKDLERCRKEFTNYEAMGKRAPLKKEQKDMMDSCERIIQWLESGKDVRFGEWSMKDVDWLNEMQLISAKPAVYLCNMSQKDFLKKKNKWLPKVKEWIDAHGGEPMIPYSAAFENSISEMPADEAKKLCDEHGVVSMLPKIIKTGFNSVQLIYFFTAGEDEVKCWQIRKHTKAPQAAGTIHTDFEKGFICAEVMPFDVLKEKGTESEVKAAGLYRQQGKEYVVQDGDICFFKVGRLTESKK